MKTEERITKRSQGDSPNTAPRTPWGRPGAVLAVLVLVAAIGAGYSYYLHRPTSEMEIAHIESLILAGKDEEARALLADAQARSRNIEALQLRLGRAFLRQGLIGPATALLVNVEGALIKEERLALAEYFLVAGDPFSAVRFYEAAMRTGWARSAPLLGRYGEALALSRNLEGAIAAMREALALDPSRTAIRLKLAETLANLKRLDEAKVEVLAVLKTEPDNEKAINLLAALGATR